MEFNNDKTQKKRVIIILIILLVISIVVPISFLSLFLREEGGAIHYFSYKEFHDQYEDLYLKDGDVVFIKDIFSGIWYNQTTDYTYMTFRSMDNDRTDPWGYDAGYFGDITNEFQSGDKVSLKIEMEQEMSPQGYPTLVGHIKSIEHTN